MTQSACLKIPDIIYLWFLRKNWTGLILLTPIVIDDGVKLTYRLKIFRQNILFKEYKYTLCLKRKTLNLIPFKSDISFKVVVLRQSVHLYAL